jgi:uncharacterized membrane protein YhhN
MRFALLSGLIISVLVSTCGAFVWFLAEAQRQTATIGGVYVLPSFASVLLPALALTAFFVLASMAYAEHLGASRTATLFPGMSAALAVAYGFYGYDMYGGAAPYMFPALFKASSIIMLGLIALMNGPRLLAAGLLFGALGDALLAWSHDTFLYGALAFLVGHICYITLFVRNGIGVRAALRDPARVALLVATVLAALVASQLTPHSSPMFVPLSAYSGVLTLMVLASYTLPWTRKLAMAGAVLFFISDGFVAWNMFRHDADTTLAFWRSFAGWMIYWAGQAALCFGAQPLRRHAT